MTTFFFYGTLMDSDVRAAVLGNYVADELVLDARLPGWQRVWLRGRSYPVVVPSSVASVEGLEVSFAAGTGKAVTNSLISLEGPEYTLKTLTLSSDGNASVFVGSRHCHPTGRPWSLSHWENDINELSSAGYSGGALSERRE